MAREPGERGRDEGVDMDRLIEQVAERRNDHEFMERLRTRLAEDGAMLHHLAGHQCRYPQPNTAGFPVNQCLDCGGWIIAAPDMEPPHV